MTRTRRALLTLLALALLKRPVDMLLAAMLPDAAVNPLPGYAAGMLASLLLLGLPAWRLRPWTSPRLPRRMRLIPGATLGVLGAALCALALPPLDAAWQGWLGIPPTVRTLPDSWPGLALMLLAMVFVPAFTEEAFFRGALLSALLDGGRRITAVLLTALTFALMHGSAGNLPSLLVLSLFLTLLMLRTSRIAVPVAAHLTYNLIAVKGVFLPVWGSLACGAGLAVLMVCLCLRLRRIAHPPMKTTDALIAAGTVFFLIILYFF